jgi:hypothetical protein
MQIPVMMEIWGKERRVKDQLRPKECQFLINKEAMENSLFCLLASCLQDLGGYSLGPASWSGHRQSDGRGKSWGAEARAGHWKLVQEAEGLCTAQQPSISTHTETASFSSQVPLRQGC